MALSSHSSGQYSNGSSAVEVCGSTPAYEASAAVAEDDDAAVVHMAPDPRQPAAYWYGDARVDILNHTVACCEHVFVPSGVALLYLFLK